MQQNTKKGSAAIALWIGILIMRKSVARRALFTSALSLLLYVSMLLGTTFAWFADSATSERNKIVAGNLDVALSYWDGTNDCTLFLIVYQGSADGWKAIEKGENWALYVLEDLVIRCGDGNVLNKYD